MGILKPLAPGGVAVALGKDSADGVLTAAEALPPDLATEPKTGSLSPDLAKEPKTGAGRAAAAAVVLTWGEECANSEYANR